MLTDSYRRGIASIFLPFIILIGAFGAALETTLT